MHAIVAAGGEALDECWRAALPARALVVAADSGLGHIYALGLRPDLVVGDLDSVSAADLARAELEGTPIERHPTDKDATDLELALDAARARGITDVTVIGAGGGRLDHELAGFALLAAPQWAPMRITAFVGTARLTVVHDHATFEAPLGSIVTLLAVGGAASGVSTEGLRWPLTDSDVSPTSTLGVSNEIIESPARVTVRSGVLFAIQPHGGL